MSQPQKLEEVPSGEHMGGVQSHIHHLVVPTTVLQCRCLAVSPILQMGRLRFREMKGLG